MRTILIPLKIEMTWRTTMIMKYSVCSSMNRSFVLAQESWLVPGCLVDVMDDNPKKECTVIEVNKEDKTATVY